MRWLRALAALTVLSVIPPLLVATPAAAASSWTPPEVLGVGGYDVQMDVGPTGAAVAAWTSARGVKASYRPVGKDWQKPRVLAKGTSGVRGVFVDRRGVARVVWWHHAELGVATRSLSGAWRLDDDPPGALGCCWPSDPAVASDDNGNLVAAWQEVDDLNPGVDRYFFWRTPSGRWTSVDGGTDSYRSGIVVVDGSATVVDGWEELREATARVNGDLRTTRMLGLTGDYGDPELAANARGDMVLAVLDGTEDADDVMQGFDPGELVLLTRSGEGGWTTAVAGGGPQVRSVAVAVNDAGGFVVAYRKEADASLAVRVGRVGGAVGPERILAGNVHPDGISVALAPDGTAAVTWTRGTKDRRPVFAATRPAGRGWKDPVRVGTHERTLRESGELPSVSAYPNGMFTAVYYDGNAARWVDLVDDDAGPTTRIRRPGRDYVTGTRIRVAWDATDALSRPDRYDVRYRSAGRGGRLGRWHRWMSGTERVDRTFPGKPGRTYCFAARSRDRVGNLGRWSAQRCATTPLDDRAFAMQSRGWDRVHHRRAYRDTLTAAHRRGQTLRLAGVSASTLRLLVRTCPGCGDVVVQHGGKRIGVVDTAGPRRHRRVLLVESYDRRRTGALVIRTRDGRPVHIDGVIASR